MPDRYSQIEGGRVVNHVLADLDFAEIHGLVPAADSRIGDLWDGQSYLPAIPAVVSLDELRAALMERATAERWKHEEGGLTLSNGVRVATTRDDQNRITSVVANAALAGVEAVDFKAVSGWTTLTFAEVRDIAASIALHVQACFSAERAHHQAIAALGTPEELAAYDVTAGWPA